MTPAISLTIMYDIKFLSIGIIYICDAVSEMIGRQLSDKIDIMHQCEDICLQSTLRQLKTWYHIWYHSFCFDSIHDVKHDIVQKIMISCNLFSIILLVYNVIQDIIHDIMNGIMNDIIHDIIIVLLYHRFCMISCYSFMKVCQTFVTWQDSAWYHIWCHIW